jgi:hypothetical protein
VKKWHKEKKYAFSLSEIVLVLERECCSEVTEKFGQIENKSVIKIIILVCSVKRQPSQ